MHDWAFIETGVTVVEWNALKGVLTLRNANKSMELPASDTYDLLMFLLHKCGEIEQAIENDEDPLVSIRNGKVYMAGDVELTD